MVDTQKVRQLGGMKIPELLKELAKRGKAGRKELESLIEKLATEAHVEDRLSDLRGKLDKLQRTGLKRAEVWRGKADSFRAEALDRMVDIQGKVVSFLGVATREQVEELHQEFERLAKRMENGQKARPSRKGAPKGEAKA